MKTNRRRLWISVGIVGVLLSGMLISDAYYTNLSEDYPVLMEGEFLEGRITGFKVHHKHTYIELDSAEKRNIPPSYSEGPMPYYLHKMIAIGDYFIHEDESATVSVVRGDEVHRYKLSHLVTNTK